MPKKKLFDEDSDEEVELKTENEYAKKYDTWRQKEELHKLEQKYGDKPSEVSESSDSEDESDEPVEVTEETETQFLKTLALLKTKDPRIYDPNYKCFQNKEAKEEVSEEEKPKPKTLTFEDSDDEDDGDGAIFTIEKKADVEEESVTKKSGKKASKEPKAKVAEYLTGQSDRVDGEVERDLAPLRALWADPGLSEGEAFLRDYILNKRYLGDGDGDGSGRLRDDEALSEDERRVEEQGHFERAYNFRFEEPDDEYLKRYPRTVSSVRPADDRRSRHRAEVRARKADDKRRKMDDIARMKALKLKEIQEKIAKIKEVTGNDDLAFEEGDIEGEFDPSEHDRRMRAIFDDHYYSEADGEKPVFPDLDDELEIENWDKYEPEVDQQQDMQQREDGPHCEDEDFNMDADYDPKQARATLLQHIQQTLGTKRRNRKNKSKLAQLLAGERPKFVPTAAEKTYAEHMEEYYKMDCEDVIGGDLPTRFKYREVVPNDYGLSVEEILLADDKELTQWAPLKRLVRHRPAAAEQSEVAAYRHKAADPQAKRRVLPSLFKDLPEEPDLAVPIEEATKKKKKKKKKKNKESDVQETEQQIEGADKIEENVDVDQNSITDPDSEVPKKKKKKKHRQDTQESNTDAIDSAESAANPSKIKGHAEDMSMKQNEKERGGKQENIKVQDKVGQKDTVGKRLGNNIEMKIKTDETESKSNVNGSTNVEAGRKKKKKNKKLKLDVREVELGKINIEENSRNKSKMQEQGFAVEHAQNERPSQNAHTSNSLKRKSNTNTDHIPKKKNKPLDHTKGKDVKAKFKKKDKLKNRKSEKEPANPLSKLSDERLKAYGLNPKKYRSFLKYKKF